MEFIIILCVVVGLIYSYTRRKQADKQLYEYKTRWHDTYQKLVANGTLYAEIEKYVYGGEHFQDICENFEEDFKFIFGDGWKEELKIPPQYVAETIDSYIHTYWVTQLVLADKGKMHELEYNTCYTMFPLQGRTFKFIQCVERRLREHNPDLDIRFVRKIEDARDGSFTLESIALGPTCRLW